MRVSKRAIPTKAMPNPKFSYSPLVAYGGYLQTAGMVGLDKDAGELVSGGMASEAKCIFSNLRAMMDEIGLNNEDMVEARVYLADFSSFHNFNAVWDDFFQETSRGNLPARTTVGVSALPLGAAIEAEFSFFKEASKHGACEGCSNGCGQKDK
ncbi:RidA family protein [Phaeobacter sp. 11ANDIMAR09]|uniref:RidA family protein n=1 Tax=Phaeobacter sp. 11ANDIMAR09 TaxID=1225647 RepID=UPI0006C87FCF|nr:RidA family protein [Phaeobacter sp. 11ANDIMAR09]